MLQVIQTVVQEEAELWNDAQLVSHLSAQVEADGLLVGIDILQNLLTLLRWEHAEVSGADAEVWTHSYLGYTYHHAVHHAGL